MEEENKKIIIDLDANTKEFIKKIEESLAKLVETEDKFKDLKETLDSFSNAFTTFGGESVKYAIQLQEALGKVENTFGKSSDTIKDFAKNSLNSFGIAESSALEMVSTFGDMSSVMGLSQENAAKVGMELTALAGDLASLKNVQLDVASTALKGIFITDADAITESGVTEALKELGIVMTETNLEQFALNQGLNETYAHMTDAEKAALRYGFVMNATKGAQGDFAGGIYTADNQMQIFTESIKELYTNFGESLLPILTKGIIIINNVIQGFSDMNPVGKQMILLFGGLIAAFPLLKSGFEKLNTLVSTLKIAFASVSAPVAIATVAIVAFAGYVIKKRDAIKQNLIDNTIWTTFSNLFTNGLGMVVEIFELFGNIISGDWEGVWENLINIVKGIWNTIVNIVGGAVKTVVIVTARMFKMVGLDSAAEKILDINNTIDKAVDNCSANTEKLTNNATKLKKTISSLVSFNWKDLIGGGNGGRNKDEDAARAVSALRDRLIQETNHAQLAAMTNDFQQKKTNLRLQFLEEISTHAKELYELKATTEQKKLILEAYTDWLIQRTKQYQKEDSEIRLFSGFENLGTLKSNDKSSNQDKIAAIIGISPEGIEKYGLSLKEKIDASMKSLTEQGENEQKINNLEQFLGLSEGTITGKNIDEYSKKAKLISETNQRIKESFMNMSSTAISSLSVIVGEMIAGTAKIKDLANAALSSISQMLAQIAQQNILLGIFTVNPGIVAKGVLAGIGAGITGGLAKRTQQVSANKAPSMGLSGSSVYGSLGQNSSGSGESYLRGSDVYWAGQRYEVIRNF
ncbi:phage tail tape measure protein [Emticicia sp. BO119]|uniref:phage tail tape measure protein n=1 Tax=Emticicia sp. BO119 TaxID=2757768 RepID=UPI0015F1029E|nr:phage tail tape measure protein [Emticicia sp. BO119]MBA4851354.1 phage tail tape measure protein [Emticicia sp. BO119]